VTTVSLAGWYMQDGVEYVFPAGSAQVEIPALVPAQPAVPGLKVWFSYCGWFTDGLLCSGWQAAVNTRQATSSHSYVYLHAAGCSSGNNLRCDPCGQQLHGAQWLKPRYPDAHPLRVCAARAGRGVRGTGMAGMHHVGAA